MRALIDIDEKRLRELDALAKRDKRSRAALIRQAVEAYLDKRASDEGQEAFGLWAGKEVDGLAYQERIRSEW